MSLNDHSKTNGMHVSGVGEGVGVTELVIDGVTEGVNEIVGVTEGVNEIVGVIEGVNEIVGVTEGVTDTGNVDPVPVHIHPVSPEIK